MHEKKELLFIFLKEGKYDDRDIFLLPTSYKILTNVLPYAEEFLGDYQSGLRKHRFTSDWIFIARHILEKNSKYCEVVHLVGYFYDSIKEI